MSPVPPMVTSLMIDPFPLRVIRDHPVVLGEFLFGEQPVLDVVATLPTAHFVEVVGEPRDLRGVRGFAAVFDESPFFAEACNEIQGSHGCLLVQAIGVVTAREPESERPCLSPGTPGTWPAPSRSRFGRRCVRRPVPRRRSGPAST